MCALNTVLRLCGFKYNAKKEYDMDNIIAWKNEMRDETVNMYEGTEPYMFISYSHRDVTSLIEICNFLKKNKIRFWYDNGLHSGDDWNLVIATRLEKASACLLLLSLESASSQYVKNELNFALNRRIPIHAVVLEDFVLPIDVEMMLGRIQMIEKKRNYGQKLLESLPSELYDTSIELQGTEKKGIDHPIFQQGVEIANRQGTISYLGTHKRLGYKVLIQEDYIINMSADTVLQQAKAVAQLTHPLFLQLYDVTFSDNRLYTFQEYHGGTFLDHYLEQNKMEELKIIEWISSVVNAMNYLYSLDFGFRDFARGSLIVTDNDELKLLRLLNNYYGVVRLQPENKQYYFEKEVEEIAVLLYQLCTGSVPILPLSMISSDTLGKDFINKVNLILQKSTKENHKMKYSTFEEILADLDKRKIGITDVFFLHRRKEKLEEYERIKTTNLDHIFTDNDKLDANNENLEERFGFDSTVIMPEKVSDDNPNIRLRICSSGQLFEFDKKEITIGRALECDMILKQPTVSRFHVKICRESEDAYIVKDLNAMNGTFVTSIGAKIAAGCQATANKGDIIKVGEVDLQLC